MLFEMLSGQLPFVADTPGKVLGMHILTPAPLLKDLAPQVPDELADLVQRLLSKDREQRPSMREVSERLAVLAEQHPVPRAVETGRHVVSPSSISNAKVDPLRATDAAPKQPTRSTLGAAASQATTRPPRRWRRIIGLVACGALLLCVGVAIFLLTGPARLGVTLERLRRAAHLAVHAADQEPVSPPDAATASATPQDLGAAAVVAPAAAPDLGPTAPQVAAAPAVPLVSPARPVAPRPGTPSPASAPKKITRPAPVTKPSLAKAKKPTFTKRSPIKTVRTIKRKPPPRRKR